ncbi:hypothetical protein [Ancylobacter amanitiformis]|uniref:Uncharacterized protein n=1 Tax=Ancylobacter amanitiformis TaxID=217069 RepID=A0ABU0LV66_9HYPH|nr:hypothetical protein [Ancylobacter amanitiformis]MDQ0512559.1 hypothetical protein [Ancylobacter amanitiformis]
MMDEESVGTLRYRAWRMTALAILGFDAVFDTAQWQAIYYHCHLLECRWIDRISTLTGLVALLLMARFWIGNADRSSDFWSKCLSCSTVGAAAFLIFYGFGVAGEGPCPEWKTNCGGIWNVWPWMPGQ